MSYARKCAACASAQRRRMAQRDASAEARREAIYGRLVARRIFIIPRIHAEARHIPGASEVTLHLIRDGQEIVPAQSFRGAVDAILASIQIVADLTKQEAVLP